MLRPLPRLLAAASLMVAALVMSAGPTASAGSDWRGFKFLGTTCRATRQGLIFAHVRVRMIVANSGVGAHWASNMRVKARLVHPGSGLDYTSSWTTARYPAKNASPNELLQDHHYSRDFTVNTDAMSALQDWRLQIKLVWDRKVPWKDTVEKFETNFNESACPGIHGVAGGT